MISSSELRSDLAQHYGSESFFKIHPICNPTNSSYTEGVKAFEKKAGTRWFLDIVFSELVTANTTKNEDFLSILLRVDSGGRALITVTDGNDKKLYKREVEWCDCPQGDWPFFFSNKVLYLPSEH
tara:strand:+ start:1269 stop:1643 length:375 start_codon:yes stop_codon:yes gene_type:complete